MLHFDVCVPRHGLERIKRLPLLQHVRRMRARSYFLSRHGFPGCFGVYSNFSEARAALPVSKEFDTEALADEYVEVRTKRVFPYDYPAMLWLRAALAAGAHSLFDIGGSVGVHYFAYRRYLAFPASLDWRVGEVPAMVRLGRELAQRVASAGLSFTATTDLAKVSAEIWHSSGAIQYMEAVPSLGSWLRAHARPPRHLVLNKLPLYAGERFVSTQNLGAGAFAPLYVYNKDEFIGEIESAGYTLKDHWDVPERSLELFDDPRRSFNAYTGLYFERVANL